MTTARELHEASCILQNKPFKPSTPAELIEELIQDLDNEADHIRKEIEVAKGMYVPSSPVIISKQTLLNYNRVFRSRMKDILNNIDRVYDGTQK